MSASRNAHFTAHQHLYLSSDLCRLSQPQIALGMHRDYQRDCVLITEIYNAWRSKPPWRRPLQSPGGYTRWQFPLYPRRLARITWINPVDMPAALEFEVQPQIKIMPRRDPLVLGDKLERSMRNSRTFRPRTRGARQQKESQG